MQAAGLAAAVAMGIHASLMLDEPSMHRFDEALVWYGFALLALAVFAWDVKLSVPRSGWRRSLAGFWSDHWIEIVMFSVILGFAVFMRAYKLGVFPPRNALAFEETINGSMAYRILLGERPLFYPVRYLDAVGLWFFGETTFGLRFFGIAMSIATVPVFYLLLRQLVRVPVALFGTALLAAAYWPSLVNRVTSATTFFTMLLAYLLIRGLRNHSALAFMGVGFLAGLISYEYEDIKPVPFYVLGFLGAIAVWQVGGAARRGWRPAREAILSILRKAWRPALAFIVAGGIVAGPLIVGTHLGKDLYLSSLHRQEGDRKARNTPGLFAPNWEQQVRWSVQLFRPLSSGAPKSRLPLSVPNIPVLDPISGILLAAGVVYGALMFFRPHRIFFLGWFAGNLGAGALLLSNWEPWKFCGLLPVGFVLAAFLINDLYSLWLRYKPLLRFSPALLSVAALGVVAYVCFWNADTMFGRVIDNPLVLTEYAHGQSQWYALCDYLRGPGEGRYAYVYNSGDASPRFREPNDTLDQQIGAWSDYLFACHGLDGVSLASSQEAWPLRDVPSGPLTLAFVVAPDALEPLQMSMEQGYPGVSPDLISEGPAGKYYVVAYSLGSEVLKSRQGLYGEYTPLGATAPAATSVDKANSISWTQTKEPLPAPFTVRWTGLVHLEEGGPSLLEAVSGDAARISIDGASAYDGNNVSGLLPTSKPLAAGWHTLEITLDKQTGGGSFSLRWVSADGSTTGLEEQDLFALHPISGWVHESTFSVKQAEQQPGVIEVTSQRIENDMDNGSKAIAGSQLTGVAAVNATLSRETFSSWWSVREANAMSLGLIYAGVSVAVLVDGTPVKQCDAGNNMYPTCNVDVTMTDGRHFVEVRIQAEPNSPWSGARLTVSTPKGPLPEGAVEITPFPKTPE